SMKPLSNEAASNEGASNEAADVSRIKVRFVIEGLGEAEGELVRFLAPRTIDTIVRKLPVEGRAALWKEEVYFEIPIKMGEEKAKPTVETGTIAFWPMGSALCIFYGKSQPYSPVSILGKITSNLDFFKQVKSGTTIKVELLTA
ncbi:MAG TPA: cyclophilin-like fold protein, partial [Verrucomicrobiae bacterium]|nr:cyclophilin-like fold protein [Verrucomicrobiae bacterium]